MKRKVILTCAVTGNAAFNHKHPNFPVTPKQIAEACAEAAQAGASIVHIHVRDEETTLGCRDIEKFKEVVSRIRDAGTDIVINLTCGHGARFLPDPNNEGHMLPGSDVVGVEERIAHLQECLPEIASLDITTANQVEGTSDYIYFNPANTLRGMAKRFRELGVKPELECFASGDLVFGKTLLEDGLVDSPAMFQFVLGILYGAPAIPESVIYLRNLLAENVHWTAFGIGRNQMPMVATSVVLGGHVRVGLEDNLYLERGIFATNGQLVERAGRIIQDIGCDIATPGETRDMLQLKNFS